VAPAKAIAAFNEIFGAGVRKIERARTVTDSPASAAKYLPFPPLQLIWIKVRIWLFADSVMANDDKALRHVRSIEANPIEDSRHATRDRCGRADAFPCAVHDLDGRRIESLPSRHGLQQRLALAQAQVQGFHGIKDSRVGGGIRLSGR
jgi:hypothetical protein